jgi:predicted metal-binding protein
MGRDPKVPRPAPASPGLAPEAIDNRPLPSGHGTPAVPGRGLERKEEDRMGRGLGENNSIEEEKIEEGKIMPPAKLKKWAERAVEMGAKRAKIIPVSSVKTAAWVRMKCKYGCGGWNRCLTCPPHSPTPEETQAVLDGYKWAVLIEGGRGGPRPVVPKLEREIFLAGCYKAFGYASGPCHLCPACDVEQACRHPEEARPAMEACGIDVFQTVRANHFEIEVLTSTAQQGHFFGMVLIE